MRIQSPRKTRQKRRLQIVLISCAVIFAGWLLPKLFSSVAAVVLYPFHSANTWLRESSEVIPSLFRDKEALHDEIERLEHELVVSGRSDLTFSRLVFENNQLRSLLHSTSSERVAAAVIARPSDLPYDLLQIDRGSASGIELGAPVFIGKDMVIGLVVHTTSEYSFVELFTTPGFVATAYVYGPDVVAELQGLGGGVARVRLPQGIPLQEGDLVVLPSIEPGVYGKVVYIENEPTQPEQYGYITPQIAISSLHLVSVGRLSQIAKSSDEVYANIKQFSEQLLLKTQSPTSTATGTDDVINEDLE